MNYSTLSVNLLDLMKKNKVTISELSEATGVAEITINKIRNSQNNNPTISTIAPIAEFFSVTINDLLANNAKQLTVIDENNIEVNENIQVNQLQQQAEFAIKITHNNYVEWQKDTILFISNKVEVKNGNYIAIKSNDKYLICKAVIELDSIFGESLSKRRTLYEVKSDGLSGVIIGALWLKN